MAKADSTREGLLSYYHFLGLEPDASPDEVTRAYQAKLAECDPYQYPKDSEERQEAEWMIESINVAFHKIVDQA
jgi:curved DNA-binding protein CbpA